MTRRSTDSSQTKRIEVHYSPWVYIPATVLFVGAAGWLGFWLVAGLFSGHLLALAVGGIAVLVLGSVLLSFLPAIVHPWRHRGPVVMLDEAGITDVRKPVSFVPWSDIRSIDLGSGETAAWLCCEFRRADPGRQDRPSLGPLGSLLNRTRFLSDWNVTLRMLACNRQDLLRSARRLHQLQVRRSVVALNDTPKSGWSGSL